MPGSSTPVAEEGEAMIGSALPETVDRLIRSTNAFDIDAALGLFAADAVIDDPSVGERFVGHAGVRDYLERFFVGYRTVTRLLSLEARDAGHASARVDFTGDFGHEIGLLAVSLGSDGLIQHLHADLE